VAIIFYTDYFSIYALYKKQEHSIKIKQEKKLIEERKKHEEEQKQQAYLHQLEMEKSEKN